MHRFNLKNAQVFDEFPTWKNLMFLPDAVRKQAFADPETRAKLRAELADVRSDAVPPPLGPGDGRSRSRGPSTRPTSGKSVADMAALRGQDPLDAFLDLSLEEDLETMFWTAIYRRRPRGDGRDPAQPLRAGRRSPTRARTSSSTPPFGYGTTLLGQWVRERGALSLEQAIHKLTFQVASVYGLEGRGLLRPGYAADLAIFDPPTVARRRAGVGRRLPRRTRGASSSAPEGMHYTVVNGQVIYDDGALSGDLPGQVLRGAAYTGQPALA